MATVKESVRYALFNYPSLYPSPLIFAETLFVHGGSHQWNHKTGELDRIEYRGEKNLSFIDMSDLQLRADQIASDDDGAEYMRDFYDQRRLELEYEIQNREFIEKNIDRICNSDITLNFPFGRTRRPLLTDRRDAKYVPAFCFPKNITKEWGEALKKFLDNWKYQMNLEYGVPSGGKGEETFAQFVKRVWPKAAQKTYADICEADERLEKCMYTPAQRRKMEKNRKLVADSLIEILKKCEGY